MNMAMKWTVGLAVVTALGGQGWADTYAIDPAHSSVEFRVTHLMVSKVRGNFEKFAGGFEYDPKAIAVWKASATIDAASINTRVEKRDAHLRSGDFFDVGKFPTLEFRSAGVETEKDGRKHLKGDLTLHGVTKSVVLDLEEGGVTKDPWGGTRAGFTASGKINRRDFGLAAGTPGAMVGDTVEITIEVEGVKK